jgi:hypothetical protein
LNESAATDDALLDLIAKHRAAVWRRRGPRAFVEIFLEPDAARDRRGKRGPAAWTR